MSKSLREHIMDAAHAMPQGRGYNWPAPGGGCFADLKLGEATILRAGKGTYCCGVTLEMLWRGWERSGATPFMRGITVEQARAMQRAWFCIGTRKGPLDALLPLGLGEAVQTPQAGDFAQLWRRNGSGHSVLVLSVGHGRISYLSTQRSTKGFGSVVEPLPDETYFVRPVP